MAGYRRATLRRMPPTTRKLARLIGEVSSLERRLKNLVPDIQRLEMDSKALFNMEAHYKTEAPREGMPDILSFENTGIPRPEL